MRKFFSNCTEAHIGHTLSTSPNLTKLSCEGNLMHLQVRSDTSGFREQ